MLALGSLNLESPSPTKMNWKSESCLGWEQLPDMRVCQTQGKRQKSEFTEVTDGL